MQITITTAFEVTTTFEADNYLHAVELNSDWLSEEYGNIEDYKTGQAGEIHEEANV